LSKISKKVHKNLPTLNFLNEEDDLILGTDANSKQ